eukprot:10082593-Heterocapsa_arctica.AAC.1
MIQETLERGTLTPGKASKMRHTAVAGHRPGRQAMQGGPVRVGRAAVLRTEPQARPHGKAARGAQ